MSAARRKPAQPVVEEPQAFHPGTVVDVPAPLAVVTRPDGQEVHVAGGRYVIEMDGPHKVRKA